MRTAVRCLQSEVKWQNSDSSLHIKCTPERKIVAVVRSIVVVPAIRVTTAVAVIASSVSTRVSNTAISVSTVLCSPFLCI